MTGCGKSSDTTITATADELSEAAAQAKDPAALKEIAKKWRAKTDSFLKEAGGNQEKKEARAKTFAEASKKFMHAYQQAAAKLLLPTDSSGPVVEVVTAMGNFKIELFPKEAPVTAKNFLDYAENWFYDDTIFHRVIPDFMIQGGGFTADMKEKPTKGKIVNEASNGLPNVRGTIA